MTPEDRIARGADAEQALTRFLSPAFASVESAYEAKLIEIAAETPWETDEIRKLAAAIKIARTVREQIEYLVTDGGTALTEKKAADRIANMSDARRGIIAQMGGLR